MGIITNNVNQAPPLQDDLRPYASPPSWLDPRADLKEDAHLWKTLLHLAEAKNAELSNVLNYFRCGATRIRAGKTGWILRPDIDPTGRHAWESQADYDEFKEKWLMPWVKTVQQLLKELEKSHPFKKLS